MGRKDRTPRQSRAAEDTGHDQGRQGAGDSAPLRGRARLVRPGRRGHRWMDSFRFELYILYKGSIWMSDGHILSGWYVLNISNDAASLFDQVVFEFCN